MKQVQVELNLPANTIRVNDVNISLEVLDTLTRPDKEKLYQFQRLSDNTVRYTEAPDEFEREWETVSEFLRQQAVGEQVSYGAKAAAYLVKLMAADRSS
jgi:hypothetical protein